MRALATDTGSVQLTISLYLLGLAASQLVLGPLSRLLIRAFVDNEGHASLAALASRVVATKVWGIGGVVWYGGNGYLLDTLAPLADGHYTFATGVNDNAEVVGQLKKNNGVVQGFLVRP